MTDKKRFTPESLFEMKGVSDPQISPDGVRVAYVEHYIEAGDKQKREPSAYRTQIMVSDGPDVAPRRVTRSMRGNDSVPRWSPDGRYLAFLSTRDGDKAQLFLLDMEGGEAVPVTYATTLSEGVRSFDWHPNGNAFCFVSKGHKTEEDVQWDYEHDERVYEGRLPFKVENVGWLDPRRAQLWRIDRDGGNLVQLTEAPCDVTMPCWSPSGREIAFVQVARPELERTYITDLFVLQVSGREVRQLTREQGPVDAPVWSPDGKQLAFLGHQQRRGTASNVGVWAVGVEDGELRCLTEGFNRSAGTTTMGDMHFVTTPDRVCWNDDGLFFTSTDHGRTGIYRVGVDGGAVEQVSTSGLSALTLTVCRDTIAFNGETNTRIGEVYTMTTGGAHIARRSHSADEIAGSYALSTPQHVSFTGADGWEIEGWFVKPMDYSDGQRYPLLLYIHGGPHADYGNGFFHEFQVLANAGYGVFFTNPRGGRSYGEEFTAAVSGHFGEKDYEDLMAAADLAASWDWVDPARMGVMGGSYGGYMTNWIITHTDRFAAACTQRSLANLYSFAGTSDIGPRFAHDEFAALPWTNEELLMAKSPMRYVKNVRTPVLILHQEQDYRTPIEQIEQFYTALVCLGVPTKLVRFPAEGHDLSRTGQPRRRVNRLNHIIGWFDRYLKDAKT